MRSFVVCAVFFIVHSMLYSCGQPREELLVLAENHMENKHFDQARQVYDQLLERNSVEPDAIEGMINISQIQNATQEQIHWCKELLKYRPWDRHANIIVGQALQEENNLEDAAIRYLIAYQNSIFKDDRSEVIQLLQDLHIEDEKIRSQIDNLNSKN